jgi:hypothetical protein
MIATPLFEFPDQVVRRVFEHPFPADEQKQQDASNDEADDDTGLVPASCAPPTQTEQDQDPTSNE